MRISTLVVFCLLAAACQVGKDQSTHPFTEAVSALYDTKSKPFYHGVASGDPLTDRVILWTRVTPEDSVSSIDVTWEISLDESFEPLWNKGEVTTSPERDYTVKVDVDGLAPNTRYFYRFTALGANSPTGRTRTLPEGNVDSLKFAVVSCSNWQHGYFNAYQRIAEKELTAVLHLGDYIYEYGAANTRLPERTHLPEHEIITLADYRTRYSQYHLDEGLKAMRQHHPLITIWDDHEVANNSFVEGAQNHQPEEGDYEARRTAARQAYYEWLPIREDKNLYRTFSFGKLADVIMLDERQAGKTVQAKHVTDPIYLGEERAMLGDEQRVWLESQLAGSTATWKVIGNQVVFSDLDRSAVTPNSPRNMDSWDGYPVEKQRIADFIRANNIANIVFLTGDTHASWAFEVIANPLNKVPAARNVPVAVEFGTPSVSSSNSNESMPDDSVLVREAKYVKSNPHLKYVNQRDHGYVLLTLTNDKARADWYYVGSVLKPDATERIAKTFYVDVNATKLQ